LQPSEVEFAASLISDHPHVDWWERGGSSKKDSASASAERVGLTYHEARSLIRAAEVADARRDQDVGDQV
jgi:hypothetical protein